IAEDVLSGAQFDALESGDRLSESMSQLFVEAIEAHVIIKEESRIIREDLLHSAALQAQRFVRMNIYPGFIDEERMMRGEACKILIHRQLIVERAGGKLAVK